MLLSFFSGLFVPPARFGQTWSEASARFKVINLWVCHVRLSVAHSATRWRHSPLLEKLNLISTPMTLRMCLFPFFWYNHNVLQTLKSQNKVFALIFTLIIIFLQSFWQILWLPCWNCNCRKIYLGIIFSQQQPQCAMYQLITWNSITYPLGCS